MAAPIIAPQGVPTMFGEVFEKHVTFCIDTSGSMYKGLDTVKEHLLETLDKMANSGKPYMFNIVEFNSEVTQWSDKLVTCSPQTVAVAKEWINKLSAKTGTNTKDALITALLDPACDSVYLVTDGLPDHHPVEILDQVGALGKMRPIHCVYLSTEDSTDSAAIEFLEDLSIESYGSFHIVCLTTRGCVERITPIYRAEHAHERVIRTVNGTIRPNVKSCGIATTLQVDPEDSVTLAPRVSCLGPQPFYPPGYGAGWYNWLSTPFRYYYPHAWSRYRPAKGWIKAQEQMIESIETQGLSPAAGSLLIDKIVLARRIEDGYFYRGKVKSQVLSDKFLVAFGPCKHGKFTETSYQDTHVYDIIDYDDAKRHTILTGDKVLAPWEPDGERYGPGTVIEGHEKRGAQGPEDHQITVSFANGKVEKVDGNVAIWVPTQVHERLTLELKMPREAREALAEEVSYPQESMEGYPTSGVIAEPSEFQLSDPLSFESNQIVAEQHRPWRYPLNPSYPVIVKNTLGNRSRRSTTTTTTTTAKSAVKSEDMNALVPGTNLTQRQLDERVMSQLMEHKLLLDERETEKGTCKDEKDVDESQQRSEVRMSRTEARHEAQKRSEVRESRTEARDEMEEELQQRLAQRRKEWELEWQREQDAIQREIERERLLKKREKQEENTLKKSVSFNDERNQIEDMKVEDYESTRDSGVRTATMEAADSALEPDTYFSDPEDVSISMRDSGVNTDASLLYRPRSRLVCRRPPWKKYWRADPGMPVTNNHQGPFRETALQAPFEARNQNQSQYISEWSSPMYKFVDPFAKHDYSNSVEKCMKAPQPPQKEKKTKYRSEPIRPMSADSKEAARREFKQRRADQRSRAWSMKMQNYENMRDVMKDQHRERIQGQINREKDRQLQEQRMIEQSRENKKFVSKEVREKIEANQKRDVDREEMRLKAMQRRREHREDVQRQREKSMEDVMRRREEVKRLRSQERWDTVQSRLDTEEAEVARKSEQHQNAKVNRIQHFQQLEQEGQRRKDVRIGVSDRHLSMFQSVIS